MAWGKQDLDKYKHSYIDSWFTGSNIQGTGILKYPSYSGNPTDFKWEFGMHVKYD